MRTILIVEDDEHLRSTLKLILIHSGYAVLEAVNGEGVGAIYEQQHPDLVITDLLMPDKDGLEVILDLRRLDRSARIIAMAGGAKKRGDTYLLLAQKFGASRTLVKPFTPDELLEAVRLELETLPLV